MPKMVVGWGFDFCRHPTADGGAVLHPQRWLTFVRWGNAFFSSSRCLPCELLLLMLMTPVILPPGRVRLVMSPRRTGLLTLIKHYDWDGARCLFGDVSRCHAADNEAVDPKPYQLCDERRNTLCDAVRKAPLDDEILAFRIAQFPEALGECLPFRRRSPRPCCI